MSDQFHLFSNYQAVKNGSWPVKVVGCSNNLLQAKGMGDITIQINVNEEWHSGILKNVLFVPDLAVNLFSVQSATKAGLRVLFNNDRVTISKGEKIVAVGESFSNHLYRLNIRSVQNHHSKDWTEFRWSTNCIPCTIQTGSSTSSPVAPSSWTHKHRNHPEDGVREVGGWTYHQT